MNKNAPCGNTGRMADVRRIYGVRTAHCWATGRWFTSLSDVEIAEAESAVAMRVSAALMFLVLGIQHERR